MKTVIIDYGAGNVKSLQFAFERLGVNAKLSNRREEILAADRVLFPGVGEASSAMDKLRQSGLDALIPELKQPVLGICLGMQLMCDHSEENNTQGLGIFKLPVLRFAESEKIPQIGWNSISGLDSKIFEDINEEAFMYMVHSYYVPLSDETIAKSFYGLDYASAIQRNNFYGVQFHPEKSSKDGSKILQNFLELE